MTLSSRSALGTASDSVEAPGDRSLILRFRLRRCGWLKCGPAVSSWLTRGMAASRCSQLSSTSNCFRSATAAASVSDSGWFPSSGTLSARATAAGARSWPCREASSTQTAPPGNSTANSRAIASARRSCPHRQGRSRAAVASPPRHRDDGAGRGQRPLPARGRPATKGPDRWSVAPAGGVLPNACAMRVHCSWCEASGEPRMEATPRRRAATWRGTACRVHDELWRKMMLPHPFHVVMNLNQRQAELLAESAYDSQARLAEQAGRSPTPQRWAAFLTTLVVLVALTLLIAAGVTAFNAPTAMPPLAAIVRP